MSTEEKEAVPAALPPLVQLIARLLQEEGIHVIDVKSRALLARVNGHKIMVGTQIVKS